MFQCKSLYPTGRLYRFTRIGMAAACFDHPRLHQAGLHSQRILTFRTSLLLLSSARLARAKLFCVDVRPLVSSRSTSLILP